jgi:DNA-binding winged helix-turn-helix (wHTH) protein/Tfp pilus assembly protein PilF/TolB-like protein
MSHQPKHLYEFGPFQLNVVERLLLRNREPVSLSPKAFDLLLALVESHGHLLEKDELLRHLWPDMFVEEANLSYNISLIRKALGESGNGQKFIETVPKHGYRFVAEVRITDTKDEGQGETVKRQDEDMVKEIATPYRRSALSPRWFLGISAILLVLTVAVYFYWGKQTTDPVAAAPQKIRSVAVLPFRPITANSHDEALEIGLSEALIAKLSGLNQLIVRPISAVRKYNRPDQDPLAAGREQGVDAVLESYLQRNGDKVRVSAHLRNVADGTSLGTFECIEDYCADIFVMQDTIAEKVAAKLTSHLTAEDRRRLKKHYTDNRGAYLLYLSGRHFADKRSQESLQTAEGFYKQALDLDPTYAMAWFGLAEIYFRAINPGLPERARMARSKSAAEKALAIDETLGEAHTARARILWKQDLNWAEAKREFERGIALAPNSGFAHQIYGNYLSSLGQYEEAIAELKLAHQIDPLSQGVNHGLGVVLYFAGKSDQALAQLREAQKLDPNFVENHQLIGMVYAQKGMYAEAIAELEKALPLSALYAPAAKFLIGYNYALWGKREKALSILEEMKELARQERILPHEMAELYTALGEKDKAFELLQQTCQEPNRYTVYLKVDPKLKLLHSDPRFAEIVRCIGLPQ